MNLNQSLSGSPCQSISQWLNRSLVNAKTSVLGTLFLITSQVAFAGALDELSVSDRETVTHGLASGEVVAVRTPIPDDLWPEFKVFGKVNSTPQQAAAVFWDLTNHKNYFAETGITKSEVQKGQGTSVQEVAYLLEVPLADDDYACEDHLSYDSASGTYLVKWDVIRSTRVVSKSPDKKLWTQGNARFEPYEGGTLIAYTNLVDPNDGWGVSWSWVIDQGEATVKKTVELLSKQIQSELTTPTLQTQINALTTSLAH